MVCKYSKLWIDGGHFKIEGGSDRLFVSVLWAEGECDFRCEFVSSTVQ